jgi:FkbM family methyltransferase
VTGTRFDVAIRNVIREHQGRGGQIMSQHTAKLGRRHLIMRPIRSLLSPLKPATRHIQRYFFGKLEANVEALRTQNDVLSARVRDINQQLAHALELTQLMHAKIDEIGLRSRGALALDESTFALRTHEGFVLVPRQDSLLLLMLLDAGPQGLEPGTRRVVSKLLAPGMNFVDIGAHIGLLTLAGARAVGPSGKVLAIEPVPQTFELLKQALAINGLAQRVEVRCLAAGARRERCKFFVRSVLGHSSFIRSDTLSDANTVEIEVDVSPLDDLVPKGERVDLVKIDVEGAELAVLEGMTRVIAENPDIAIIAEFGPSHLKANQISPESWFSAFRDRGFDAFAINELSSDCPPVDLRKLADIESINILFGRRNSSVLARIL